MTVDQLIEKYSAELQEIYDNQRAGDFTFTGVLAKFALDLQKIISE